MLQALTLLRSIYKEERIMVEKNARKLKAKKQRVMNGFNTGTRDMKLKTAYKRKKKWSEDEQSSPAIFFL